jgi:hypothetical protein
MEPQLRSINIINVYDEISIQRVWFPYTAFIFRYFRFENNFKYGGLHGHGLRIGFSNRPWETTADPIFQSPTESFFNYGYSCTDHILDYKIFSNPQTLMATVLDSWWSSAHAINNSNYFEVPWQDLALEQVKSIHWRYLDLIHENLPNQLKYKPLMNKPIRLTKSLLSKIRA